MKYIILFSYLWVTFIQAESIYITDKNDTNTSKFVDLINPNNSLEGKFHLGSNDIHIQWGEGLNLDLKKEGLRTTTEGLRVFGSFRLKDEQFRSVKLTGSIRYPLHNMLLVRHNNIVYIIDLKKEEMIGQFKIPSRGTPRFLKIEPYENGYTSLKVMFRMLPRARMEEEKKQNIIRIGRPGPLITKIMIYKDGKYFPLKRKGK